jgi:hypothetical protein
VSLFYHNEIFLSIIFVATMEGSSHYISKISVFISPNVPAVYDVLAARISKCVAFAGRTKCAGGFAWEWSEAE